MSREAVATIGFFDGVHRGHQYVLQQLCRIARTEGRQAIAITFYDHPRHLQHLLTPLDERQERLLGTGIDRLQLYSFAQIQPLTAEQFMHRLHDELAVRTLLLGYDHHFGSDLPSRFSDYQAIGSRVGIEVRLLQEMNKIEHGAAHISSTAIRHRLEQGEVRQAADLLGYRYELTGSVEHGRQIGRTIGFPTANLHCSPNKLLPASGVYVAVAHLEQTAQAFPALLNIGTNPTIADANDLTVEIHLIDYTGDLYGKTLRVELIDYLRAEQRFATLDELAAQIQHDKESALQLLAAKGEGTSL